MKIKIKENEVILKRNFKEFRTRFRRLIFHNKKIIKIIKIINNKNNKKFVIKMKTD